MAFPDTIILLIVDYHAANGGGKKPVTPLAYAPPDIDRRRGGGNVCASRPSWHAPFAAVPLRCALYSVTRIDIFGT